MSALVELTDAEMAQSFTVAGDDFHDGVFDRETVESIVAARVAEALEQIAHRWNDPQVHPEWDQTTAVAALQELFTLADEYDPKQADA